MPKPIHQMSSWGASAPPPREVDERDDENWEATRQQIGPRPRQRRDQDDYLAQAQRQIGRQVGQAQWELFVVIDPAEALQQQFDQHQPEYIALHDIGTQSSRRMLAGLAAATGRPVNQLHIRRQGPGVPLAKLEFVELPIGEGQPVLRMYTTEIDADTPHRRRLARLLMARSRLCVVLVGDLAPHALATALLPLHDAIREGPWSNRELLMLPLAGASALAKQASHLAIGSAVAVRTTPLVMRPSEAWNYLRGTWNKLRAQLGDAGLGLAEIVDPEPAAASGPRPTSAAAPLNGGPSPAREAPTAAPENATRAPRAPLPMRPTSALRASAAEGGTAADPALATYLRKCGELKGMISCCVFDQASQRTIGHTGARPGPAALASHGAALISAMVEAAHNLNLGDAAPDAAITLGNHHLLLRAVPARPGLALHAVLDRAQANLALLRLQLQRLDLLLEDGDTA